ncbi:MAG TPA: insulinase family protein, partial [Thermoanaerobaculia bacterium]
MTGNLSYIVRAVVITSFAVSSMLSAAEVPSPATIAENAKLPLDPAVRTGKLRNGLTYYVRRNTRPEKRADIWLAVNAGSTLEDEDQRGLAHFVEHMAFRGTANFKKHDLIDFLERTGMKFGPDINAFTSFDETVYTLRIPTDDPEVVRKSLLVLSDWAHNVSFDADDVDKERGVVIEEWRLGRGAEARMRDQQFPVLFQGSRYAERLTIGKKEILEKASRDTIRRFYRDWYRPNLMAVIAVGDFDAEAMEKAIRAQFSSIPNPPHSRPRTLYPVPDHDATLVSIATDPEATSTRVQVLYKKKREERSATRDYRRHLVERLYYNMVDDRLNELRRNADPPFLFAFSGSGSFVRTKDVVFQTAGVQDSGLERGLQTLLTELARVDQHGFTATELDRAKKEMLRSYEQMWKERDKQESELFTREILSAFLEDEPMPGIEFEHGLAQRFVPAITLDEVNAFARGSITERNRVILVNAPAKAASSLPSVARIRETFTVVHGQQLDAWVDRVRQAPLVPQAPTPGTIVEETAISELGVTRWKLSNGITVLLKPTDFKNDQVLLSGFSPGGSSLLPDAKFVSSAFAGPVLAEGGLGQFDSIELEKALSGKIASAVANVGELEETISGRASPQDLDTLFQLLYLKVTAPRVDPKAFESWKSRTKASIENRMARPETVFGDKMQVTMSGGHFRRRPISPEMLAEIDLDTAAAVWRDRFADAGNFTFGIVGAFKIDEI